MNNRAKAKRNKIKMNRTEMCNRLAQLTDTLNIATGAENPSELFPVDSSEFNMLIVALLAGINLVDDAGDRRSFRIGRKPTASETSVAMNAIVATELWDIVAGAGTGAAYPDGVGPEKTPEGENNSAGKTNSKTLNKRSMGKKEAAELLFGPGGYTEGGVRRTDVDDIISLGDALRRRKVTVITVTAAGIVLATAVGVGLWLLLRDDSSANNEASIEEDDYVDDPELGGPTGDDEDEGPTGD